MLFGQPPKNASTPRRLLAASKQTRQLHRRSTCGSPGTVNNFVVLARYHYYDSLTCHRIIKDFVVQCGDPSGTGGGVEPGYTILDELPAAGSYKAGSLAMANTGSPNSGGGQFFIITGSNGETAAKDALFGSVTGYDDTSSDGGGGDTSAANARRRREDRHQQVTTPKLTSGERRRVASVRRAYLHFPRPSIRS